jgi:hypothetical protein
VIPISNLIRWVPPEQGTSWDRVRIYSSATQTGTFALAKELDSTYAWWWDEDSPSSYYYKLTFYDTVNAVESDFSDAFTASTSTTVTTKELRRFMGLREVDDPDDNILMSMIIDANVEFQLDKNFTDTGPSKLALKMLSASYVCQWRGQRVLNGGTVNFAIDGVSVQKPFGFFMDQAKYWRTQYDEFIWKYATESMTTMPISDSGYEEYSDYLVEIMNGATNARNSLALPSQRVDNTVYVES